MEKKKKLKIGDLGKKVKFAKTGNPVDKILVGTRWPDPWMLEEVTSWIHVKVTEYVYASRRDFVDSMNRRKEKKGEKKSFGPNVTQRHVKAGSAGCV